MPTVEQVRDLTLDTIEGARGRAEDLVSTSSQGLAKAVTKAAKEVRDHAPDIDLSDVKLPDVKLPDVELPAVDELVGHAASHKVRTTLIVSALVLAAVLLLRKLSAGDHEPDADTAG